ncbi:unnamed protein product [Acanthoscelides obtectus]|uniref:Uncharacterized protein n=1 Tax=Acanthoscelides obtectus TaxID=200917 RepID=A0A9P0LE79_ACAOB|nr:unnamed protein product [Acanthoscelides obtectus]CAK1655253.1 hypothetical protein AOBTE_LOCUS19110 [Acanthoscelides obtectus]
MKPQKKLTKMPTTYKRKNEERAKWSAGSLRNAIECVQNRTMGKKTVVKQKKTLEGSNSESESPVLQESDTSADEWDENECDYRNLLNNLLKTRKKEYYDSKIKKTNNSSKILWDCVNEISGKRNKKAEIDKIKIESGEEISNKNDIAQKFLEHFTSIGEKLTEKIPRTAPIKQGVSKMPHECWLVEHRPADISDKKASAAQTICNPTAAKNLREMNRIIAAEISDQTDFKDLLAMIYAGAFAVLKLNGQRPTDVISRNGTKRQPAWERRLSKNIDNIRSDIDILTQYQKPTAREQRIRSYTTRETSFPNTEDIRHFWSGIWSNPREHRTAHWYQQEKARTSIQAMLSWTITKDDVVKAIVLENQSALLYWDRPVRADKTVDYNRPDILLIDKNKRKAYVLDIAVPLTVNIIRTEYTKAEKYQNLTIEIKNI